MYEQLYVKFVDKYNDKIKQGIEPKSPLHDFLNENIEIIHDEVNGDESLYELAFLKLYKILIKYILCANGFMGYDISQLGKIGYKLLLSLNILENENLTQAEEKLVVSEIESLFYFFVNILYNIKDKVSKFVDINFKKNKPKFERSILSCAGKGKITDIVENLNNDIKLLLQARRDSVHNKYEIKYNKDDYKIEVSLFLFDLTEGSIEELNNKKYEIDFKKEDIVRVLNVIYDLRVNFCNFLRDRNNIDKYKLLEKFKSKSDNQDVDVYTFSS